MRHQKRRCGSAAKPSIAKALLANQVCNLIEHQRIKTTLAKAKAVRPIAEKWLRSARTARFTRGERLFRPCGTKSG